MSEQPILTLEEWGEDFARVDLRPPLGTTQMDNLPSPHPIGNSYKGRTQSLTYEMIDFRGDLAVFNSYLQKVAEQIGYRLVRQAAEEGPK